jgi:cytidylate kinase
MNTQNEQSRNCDDVNFDKQERYFIVLIGPPAVGKMTVGEELANITGFRLFHNHLAIECVLPVFDFEYEKFQKLVNNIRELVFQEFVQSDYPGLIFTFVWAFNKPSGYELMSRWIELFSKAGFKINFIELQASLEQRLYRNRTENRLQKKASKQNLNRSEEILLKNEKEWVMIAPHDFIFSDLLIRIDTEQLTSLEVARLICEQIGL